MTPYPKKLINYILKYPSINSESIFYIYVHVYVAGQNEIQVKMILT